MEGDRNGGRQNPHLVSYGLPGLRILLIFEVGLQILERAEVESQRLVVVARFILQNRLLGMFYAFIFEADIYRHATDLRPAIVQLQRRCT